MAGTLSPPAQPTGLHCTGAGGWLSPSDPLQLLALITALCPHTVQMGPFVGLSWSLGVMGKGWAGESRRGGCHEDLLCHLKKGKKLKTQGPKTGTPQEGQKRTLSIRSIVQLALWLEYIIIQNSRICGSAV